LVAHDTRSVADVLDRNAVLDLLGGSFRGTLVVPEEAKACAGADAAWETRSLRDAVIAALEVSPEASLTVFDLDDDGATEASSAMAILRRVQDRFPSHSRKLVVTRARYTSEPTLARRCKILSEAGLIDAVGLYDVTDDPFRPAAIVESDEVRAWALEVASGIHVSGSRTFPGVDWLDADELRLSMEASPRLGGNAWVMEISPHPPLAPKEFFEKLFLAELTRWNADLPAMFKEDVVKIDYADRYIRSVGCGSAFAALVNGLVGHSRGGNRPITITSLSVMNRRPGETPSWREWQSDLDRQKDLQGKLPSFSLKIMEVGMKDASHQRMLSVHFSDGRVLRIMMDPGVDYWETTRELKIAPTDRNKRNGEKQMVIVKMEDAS
jgi:hypothetical protein